MDSFVDNYKHKGLRKKLVEIVVSKGITDKNVIEAIAKIPRHWFIGHSGTASDSALLSHAYEDKAFPIGAGQTISQPYTVAFQTELLQIKKGDKVLEIGTGSGYQTAVLLELGAKVYTIERQKQLFDKTKAFLPAIGYNPKFFYGDGYKGLPIFAPFDKIIVTAGAPYLPEDLIQQLKPEGIMVIPLGEDAQIMTTFSKKEDGTIVKKEYGMFRFVPLLKNKQL
jgi:protein-L-isoaspartate(D-aspartate) O-methyltransferase